MKKFKKLYLLFLVVIAVILTSCSGSEVKIDYADEKSFEEALNNGENLEGKVVQFVALDLKPSSAFGYNIFAGEHLNFVSARNPDVKKGDIVTVRTTTIESIAGSWIINYEKINSESGANSTDLASEEVEGQQEITSSGDSNDDKYSSFITGNIVNNNSDEILSLRIAVVLKKEGKVVCMDSTFVSSLKPGKEIPFECQIFDDLPEHDTIEVYAVL